MYSPASYCVGLPTPASLAGCVEPIGADFLLVCGMPKTLDARLREHDNHEVIPAQAGIQKPYLQLQAALVMRSTHWWPMLPTLRRLFEGIRQLQHAELILMASDNLHADGQAFRRETARHGDGGQTCHRHKVARLHPINVGLHLHAIDLRDVGLLYIEWEHLTDR